MGDASSSYMTDTKAYPIARCESEIVPLLRDEFCRGVVLRDPQLAFNPAWVSARPDPTLAKRYWHDADAPRGRLASGRDAHTQSLSAEVIAREAEDANIVIASGALPIFTERCNRLRGIFERVFIAYTGIENAVMRGYTLFTPVGGRGRSPELHVDNTILTLHWAAALATLSVHDGDLDERTWLALDRGRQNAMNDKDRARNHEDLIAAATTLSLVENAMGDAMISKGQLGKDLADAVQRRGVCVHVSSPTITENGQAGFLMTPKMSA